MSPDHVRRIILAVTGASGAAYARRILDQILVSGAEAHLIVSTHGRRLLHDELGVDAVGATALLGREEDRLIVHPYKDVGSVLGSGSFHTDGMIVCPCSTHTLAAIAGGLSDNLIHRAAAVTLKERRRLVLVVREMPLTHIDLLNCLRVSEAGGILCPASPGYYMLPRTIGDLVDFVAGKALDLVGVPHALNMRWERSEARNS